MAPLPVQSDLHQILLDTMAEGVVVQDWNGSIVFANGAASQILGLTEGELIGKSSSDADWEAIRPDGTAMRASEHPSIVALKTRQPAGPEVMGVRRGGNLVWLRVRAHPIEIDAPEPRAVLATFADITDLMGSKLQLREALDGLEQAYVIRESLSQRLAQFLGRQLDVSLANLSETEQRFRLAMELGTSVAFTLDTELRYTWAHSCQVGFRDEELIGKTEYDVFAKETADRLCDLYRQVLVSGQPLRQDVEVQSLGLPTPQYFDLIVRCLYDSGHRVAGLICAAIDITARKQTERDLRQAKESAERALASKSRFLAAASHDLSQPMQALQMYCAILADRQPNPGLQAKQCANQLSRQLKALLALSRLDSGGITVTRAPVRLSEMLDHAVAASLPLAGEKGLRLRVVATSLSCQTDSTLMERLVGNLVSNAVRYTETGGVVVGCRRRAGGGIRIEVWDSGIGIPQDQLPYIFEELFQLNNPTRRTDKGLGLGLAIVDRIAQILGISVSVRSVVGRGSVFLVDL
ncbi:MAG: PAS domain-containing protein [Magnetospirillum sp.]|nr:PAS domain-containing protein [Magnetospirillum sp.]